MCFSKCDGTKTKNSHPSEELTVFKSFSLFVWDLSLSVCKDLQRGKALFYPLSDGMKSVAVEHCFCFQLQHFDFIARIEYAT